MSGFCPVDIESFLLYKNNKDFSMGKVKVVEALCGCGKSYWVVVIEE